MGAPIPIAVVGTGFGARIQVPGLRASGRFVVAAFVGRRPDRVRRVADRLGVPRALGSVEEALALPEVAAVSIATPPDTHAEYAIAVARAGRHVLCEKPMARTVAEAEAMRAAARAAGVVGLIDHEFRFEPARATAGRLFARGALGAPRRVTAVASLPLFADTGRPAPVFRMVSGAEGVMQQTAVAWGPPHLVLRVAGSEATAWIDGDGRLWRAGREDPAAEVEVPEDLRLPPVTVPPEAGPFAARELPAFVRQAERFADAIERPGLAHDPPAATFDDGVACQRVMDAARASAREGRWVRLD